MRNALLSGAAILTVLVAMAGATPGNPSARPADWYIEPATKEATWVAPVEASIPNDASGELIRYGKKMVTETYKYLGPGTKVPYTNSLLACTNCHLDQGTSPHSAPWAVVSLKLGGEGAWEPRQGIMMTLPGRIDACMTRSMAGRVLDRDSREMRGMIAYINWLNTGIKVKDWKKVIGTGLIEVEPLDRAADLKRGKQVYDDRCATCHADDGNGVIDGLENGSKSTIVYPALWGPRSFGDSGGMGRLATATRFVKANMPYGWANGADRNQQLSNEDAWDVTAYMLSHDRPNVVPTAPVDWSTYGPDCMPSWMSKPPDTSYGPYYPRVKPDGTLTGDLSFPAKYSEERHKYGPYKAMLAEQKQLKEAYKKAPNAPPSCTTPAATPAPARKIR